MKPRTLAILTALTLVLGLFIFFFERDLPSTDERRDLDKKVLGVTADDVTGLTLQWPEGRVRFVKGPTDSSGDRADHRDRDHHGHDHDDHHHDHGTADGEWRLVEPVDARADGAAVGALVERLANLEKERTLEDVDRGQLGLDRPRASAILVTAAGPLPLHFGADLPLGGGLVVQSDEPWRAFQVQGAGDLVDEMRRDAG
ncbi:MAG: DUF4340 domain-containing protein, partial [Acidobacteriota bacterium]